MIFLTRQTFQDIYKEVFSSLTLRLLTVISNTVLTSIVISYNKASRISNFWQGRNNFTPKVSGICPGQAPFFFKNKVWVSDR